MGSRKVDVVAAALPAFVLLAACSERPIYLPLGANGGGVVSTDLGTPKDPSRLDGNVLDADVLDADHDFAAAPDLAPPSLEVELCPGTNAQDAATNTAVVVRSNVQIDPTTVSPSSFAVSVGGVAVTGSLSVKSDEIVFEADQAMPANATVMVMLDSAIRDIFGRSLAPNGNTWSFRTGGGPESTREFIFSPPVMPSSPTNFDAAIGLDGEQSVLFWRSFAATVPEAGQQFTTMPLSVVSQGLIDSPSLALADGVAHFAWADTGSNFICYSNARDDWSAPASPQYCFRPTGGGYGPSVAVGSHNRVALAWGTVAFANDIGVATSDDGGATFSVQPSVGPGELCATALYSDDVLLVAWVVNLNLKWELRLVTSSDNGQTPSTPIVLAQTTPQIWCPQLVDDHAGNVLVLYEVGGYDNRSANLIRFAPATQTIVSSVQLYPLESSSTSLAGAPNGRMVLAHSVTGAGAVVRISDDRGQTFGLPQVADVFAKNEGYPIMTYASSGKLAMAWHHADPSGTYNLVVSRGTPKRPCE